MADPDVYSLPRREGDHRFVTRQAIERAQPFDLACIVGKYLARMEAYPGLWADAMVPRVTAELIDELRNILDAIDSREPRVEYALATHINRVQGLVGRLMTPEQDKILTRHAVNLMQNLVQRAHSLCGPLGEIEQ